jgi:TetR/AcrR family transcriptional repressor of uid operon
MGRIAGVSPEETRSRLLDAAVEVFASRGYEGARVTDITRAAGLSSGAIYTHYTSKAELLVDAIRAHGPDEMGRLMATGGRRERLPDVLQRIGAALEHRDQAQGTPLLEALAATRRDPELCDVLAGSITQREDLMAELARRALKAGDLDEGVSPEVVARFCLMVALGAMVVRVLDLPPTDTDEWSRFIGRLVDSFRADESDPGSEESGKDEP